MAFKPEIWSALTYDELFKRLVALGICNDWYRGDVVPGGTVHIYTPGSVTSKPYTKNTDIDAPEIPTDADNELLIDQQEYTNVGVDDIDEIQSSIKLMTGYANASAYALGDGIDQFILGKYTDAGITDTLYDPDIDSVYQFFNDMFTTFSTANIPTEGRSATVTPRVKGVINEYLAGRSTQLGDSTNVNGYVGNFAGWQIRESNNVVKTTTYVTNDSDNCVFSHISAMTFAFQIPPKKMIFYRVEKQFAEALKILAVYGHKTLDTARLGAGKFVW
jgi:hypothetical protein